MKQNRLESVVFVIEKESPLEVVRGQRLSGQPGLFFDKHYLAPLGLSRSQITIKTLDEIVGENGGVGEVVALGAAAKRALPWAPHLPHPRPAMLDDPEGQKLMAKVRAAKRLLLFGPDLVLQKSGELATSQSSACRVAKADEAKRIVYSIVLDPYQIDAQGDWIPPNEIEDTAHQFLVRSRVIGYRHQKRANASVVESAVEPYPPEQYELAMKNEAHSAYRRPFGGDKIHSGSWFIGIKLDEPLWKEYLAGKIDAVSIGGEGVRTDIDTTSMPEVTFIDLEAKEPIEQ